MAVMKRGSNVDFTREIPGLTGVVVGVRWDAGAERPLADNLVMATILCDSRGKALSDEHFVFFNQLTSPELSVTELETSLGDDNEQVEIDLQAVPADVVRIAVVLYINEGTTQRRTLGQLKTCEVRLLDLADNKELVRSENLAPALSSETAMSVAEVYRYNSDWKFKVLGDGYAQGIAGVARDYGLTL
jgi:tellurium resistance protein TerD